MRLRDLGEKRFIAEYIRPLFNPSADPDGVGDDCARIAPAGQDVIVSTDRVPADLIAFRHGIIDLTGLGRYLARLNLSDIAACGGTPAGLLLNLGLPEDALVADVMAICRGFLEVAARFQCPVLGGDMTTSKELSLSATALGRVPPGRMLRRGRARPGDTLFVSRPLGLTPAAFAWLLRDPSPCALTEGEQTLLFRQFRDLEPLVDLGRRLADSGSCTSCMDNTDGVGQCLRELADASGVGFLVDAERLGLDPIVNRIARSTSGDPIALALSGGADFSLVGTLAGEWAETEVHERFGADLRIIGRATRGDSLELTSRGDVRPLTFTGWNYWNTRRETAPASLQISS